MFSWDDRKMTAKLRLVSVVADQGEKEQTRKWSRSKRVEIGRPARVYCSACRLRAGNSRRLHLIALSRPTQTLSHSFNQLHFSLGPPTHHLTHNFLTSTFFRHLSDVHLCRKFVLVDLSTAGSECALARSNQLHYPCGPLHSIFSQKFSFPSK